MKATGFPIPHADPWQAPNRPGTTRLRSIIAEASRTSETTSPSSRLMLSTAVNTDPTRPCPLG
jgi:hypothetical protein